MVKFDELSISSDSTTLFIKASILDIEEYKDYYIKEVYIQTKYEDTPTSSPAIIFTDKPKSIDLTVNSGNADVLFDARLLKNNLIFVYIKAVSDDDPDGILIACNKKYTIGAVYNDCPIRNKILQHVKELNTRCDIPKNFINQYLRWKALNLAICLNHFNIAQDLYKDFVTDDKCSNAPISKPCNCNG